MICWDVAPPTLAPSAQSRTGTPVCDPTGEQTLAPQHSPALPPAPFLLLGLPVLVFFWLSEALAGLVVFLPTNKTCSTCCCCPNVWDPLREKMLVTGSAWVVCSEGYWPSRITYKDLWGTSYINNGQAINSSLNCNGNV